MIGALSGWAEFVAALTAFLASHVLPARPPVRRFLRARLGGMAYAVLYSLVSLAILAWLIGAAARAPQVRLWDFEPWQLWVPNAIMPFACLLIAFGIGDNPFSLGGKEGTSFNPEQPGIASITRYPLLWAITLWALAHIIPNGDLAHVLLFGLFAVFGIVGMAALDGRRRREWGPDLWAKRSAGTSFIPFAAILIGRTQLRALCPDPMRVIAALALYLAALLSHQWLIGVSPLPPL